MNYEETKEKLAAVKLNLLMKLKNPQLSKEEMETIKNSIDNYEYILELTDMNHFERGKMAH